MEDNDSQEYYDMFNNLCDTMYLLDSQILTLKDFENHVKEHRERFHKDYADKKEFLLSKIIDRLKFYGYYEDVEDFIKRKCRRFK